MFNHHLIKRSLATGVAIAAAGLPASAQALVIEGPTGSPPSGAAGPSVPQRVATSHSSFKWSDAGIGAAVATGLLGAGALGVGASRRRRPVTG
jgi:hypothetical protein